MIRPLRQGTRLLAAAALAAVAGAAPALATPQAANVRLEPWSPEIVDLVKHVPVQEGGRVKPLDTYASFTLLRMHGTRSVKTPAGERLGPVEWLLDVLFFPEASWTYPLFIVQDSAAIEAIGLPHEGKKKRDRYSLEELRPGIPRLFQLAREYGVIEEKDRSSVQQQVFNLATNVDSFMQLSTFLDFGRETIPVRESRELRRVFGERSEVSLSDVLPEMPELRAAYERLSAQAQSDPDAAHGELLAVSRVLQRASDLTEGTHALAILPPDAPADEAKEWLTPADVFAGAFLGSLDAAHVEVIEGLEELVPLRHDQEAFQQRLSGVHGRIEGMARSRGEYDKIPLEVTYYEWKLLDYGQYAFVLAFLLMAFMWMRPTNRVLYAGTNAVVAAGTLLLCAAIAMRCIIRGRPPVSTLYETVLFVTAVGVITTLFIEMIGRRRIALSAGALLGMAGLFIANGYEILDKRDTMPSLVAVLDTNFYLAIHVTTITMGYAAGMLAALLASIYLVGKLFPPRKRNPAFFRNLGRMVYGVLCFGLFFSVFGTIMGGIWANDSWGRFWGWDPKENGALLIVLSQLVILHARAGGYIREHGTCMAAAFGGTIVAFSWWGVNLLGVGLHSYGFTSGIARALWTYYGIQWGIMGLGGLAWLLDNARAATAQPVPARRQPPPGARREGEVGHTTA